jgi:D-alanyl-D-alanine carboxypeptidase
MMTRTSLHPLITAALLLPACASTPPTTLAQGRARLRAQLQASVAKEAPGTQYIAVNRDGVLVSTTVGFRDMATGEPMDRSTLMMSYSITKVITAIAALQLIEQGKLALDAPLSRYVPEHPYGDEVTIRTLLNQTSGVPNPWPLTWFFVDGARFDRKATLQQVLRDHGRLDFQPGTKYQYSNISYWLLEEAIERASGQDYAAYVADRIFEPLALTEQQASFTIPPRQRLAVGHGNRLGLLNTLLTVAVPGAYKLEARGRWSRYARLQVYGRGYGGLYCTADALAAVLRDLLRTDSALLGRDAKAQLFSLQKTRSGEPTKMTLGWLSGDLEGKPYFGKQAGGIGFHGNIRIYPKLGLATVLLSNSTRVSAGAIDKRSDALDANLIAGLTRE